MGNWIDNFSTVVGGVTDVIDAYKGTKNEAQSPQPALAQTVTPKQQGAVETAQPVKAEGTATTPAASSPWLFLGLGALALILLMERN
jgi:hypothetical protein